MSKKKRIYQDFVDTLSSECKTPVVTDFDSGVEYEYRCPFHSKCPAKAYCFIVSTPVPLQDGDILNVRCRCCGNDKISVYAKYAESIVKK